MSLRHLFGREDLYVIVTDQTEGRRRPWRASQVSIHGRQFEASVSWTLFMARYDFGWGAMFGTNGGESDCGLDVHAGPLVNLYLRARHPWLKWLRSKDYEPRHTGLVVHSHQGNIAVAKLAARDGMTRAERKRHEWSASWWQLWGRTRSTTVALESGACLIPMPEGCYPAIWTHERTSISHIRWPGTWRDIARPRIRENFRLDVPGGIPHWGKGENSWDCGMDGLFGVGGKSIEEAIGNAVRWSLRDRNRNGGPHDLPHPMTLNEAEAHMAAR